MSLETDNGKLILLELVGGKITKHITIDNAKSHPLIKIETVFFCSSFCWWVFSIRCKHWVLCLMQHLHLC